jgi:hypothetical protein
VDATLLLADYARVAEGKLDVVGGGWTITTAPANFGVGILFQIPWDRTNTQIAFTLELVDVDGQVVTQDTDDGPVPVAQLRGAVSVGRPVELRPGTPQTVPFAANFAAMPLPAGTRFAWRLSIDDDADATWSAPFSTRAASA